jgi:hypothetical protein
MLGDIGYHEECNTDPQTQKEEYDKIADISQPCQQPKFSNKAVKFDWNNRWLNGEEYSHILANAELYMAAYSFRKYPQKTHPPSTYLNPESNLFN